jgi:hypothetical protein
MASREGQSAAGRDINRFGGNGKLDESSLTSVGGNHKLQPAAAEAYKRMVDAAQKDGVTWSITDSYRPLAVQEKLAKEKGLYSQGGLAAAPGTSNHGWGAALDLGSGANKLGTKQNQWLQQHAAEYGFGTIPREPWHWEFRGGGINKDMANTGEKTSPSGSGSTQGATIEANAIGSGMGAPPGMGMPNLGMVGGMLGGALGGRAGGLFGAIAGGMLQQLIPQTGSNLAQSSAVDQVNQRSSGQVIQQQQSSTSQQRTPPPVDATPTVPDNVAGNVEPADAATRFKRLFDVTT